MKKIVKLETYLLFTNLLQGIFWIISGISDCIKNVPKFVSIFFVVFMCIFIFTDIFILFSKRESFDEFSQNIKQKADSNILGILVSILVLVSVLGSGLSLFNKELFIPWYALGKICGGFVYCAQYIVYIVMEKQLLSNDEGDENVQD